VFQPTRIGIRSVPTVTAVCFVNFLPSSIDVVASTDARLDRS
jgi:hypothetical protein